jgi:hypothetical protein
MDANVSSLSDFAAATPTDPFSIAPTPNFFYIKTLGEVLHYGTGIEFHRSGHCFPIVLGVEGFAQVLHFA